MWKTQFESLLNNDTTDSYMQYEKVCVKDNKHICYDKDILITPCMLRNGLYRLKYEKHVTTIGYLPNTLCMMIGPYLYFCPFSIIKFSLMDIFLISL